jgi:hypothetical protein
MLRIALAVVLIGTPLSLLAQEDTAIHEQLTEVPKARSRSPFRSAVQSQMIRAIHCGRLRSAQLRLMQLLQVQKSAMAKNRISLARITERPIVRQREEILDIARYLQEGEFSLPETPFHFSRP